jgi:hypothetical protein
VLQSLAAPHLAAYLDDLPDALQRRVAGDAVPALDDLRTRGAQAEGEAPVGDDVEAGGGHGQQCGRPAVDGEVALVSSTRSVTAAR